MVLRCKRSQRLQALVASSLLLHCIVLQARLDLASKLQRAAQQCEERNNRTHQQQAIRSISAITIESEGKKWP